MALQKELGCPFFSQHLQLKDPPPLPVNGLMEQGCSVKTPRFLVNCVPRNTPSNTETKGHGGGTIQLRVNAPLTVNGRSTSRKTRPQRSHREFSLPSQHTGGYWFSSHSHPTPSHPGRCIRKPYCTLVAPHHLLEMQCGENT